MNSRYLILSNYTRNTQRAVEVEVCIMNIRKNFKTIKTVKQNGKYVIKKIIRSDHISRQKRYD